ncbi:YhcN/YlaJ family sporulation lipoprotein [Neobacillus sp. D3-1R]|uniref:YhcN/YlaJ family sporulation lipoprotein n=1 Tax=Neobacillus sp. D3-1R TaxID=3445778 RepID=UPI003FA03D58
MNKRYLALPLSAVMAMGLVGCGNNDEAGVQNRNNAAQPMGYYSNENHGGNGNARVLNDNDGPITEMMDHTYGTEGTRNVRQTGAGNGNPANPTVPLANTDQNFYKRDNRFSRSDANYHGHLNDNTKKARSSYYTAYEGELTEKIGNVTGTVSNVEDVRSVTYGSNVLIAVDLTDYSREAQTKRDIEEAVQPYLRGRSVTVVTDEGTFSRLRQIDNDLRNGGPKDGLDTDLKNMFQTLKNRMTNNNR